MVILGEHYLAELALCNSNVLSNRGSIENILLESSVQANAHRKEHEFRRLNDGGISGVIVIEESHISIHTFPERAYAIADFFTCSPDVNEEAGIAYLVKQLGSKNHNFVKLDRGPGVAHKILYPEAHELETRRSLIGAAASSGKTFDHVIIEAWGINETIIGKKESLEAPFLEAAKEGGQKVIYHKFHNFSPFGTSGFVLGEKSHLTVHSWPEKGYCAIDILGASGEINIKRVIESLFGNLNPTRYDASRLTRGSLDTMRSNHCLNQYRV
ncbi:MAG: adenosylmethionine decarboxylase [archaeon]